MPAVQRTDSLSACFRKLCAHLRVIATRNRRGTLIQINGESYRRKRARRSAV